MIFKFFSFFAAKRTRDPRESSREYGRKIQVEKTMERLSPLVFLLFLSAVNLFDCIWVSQQQSRCIWWFFYFEKCIFFLKPHAVRNSCFSQTPSITCWNISQMNNSFFRIFLKFIPIFILEKKKIIKFFFSEKEGLISLIVAAASLSRLSLFFSGVYYILSQFLLLVVNKEILLDTTSQFV